MGSFNIVFYFALIMISNIFIGFLIGKLFNHYTGNNFWYVVFMLLGVFSGFYSGIKEIMKEAEKYENSEKENKRVDKKNNTDRNN